MNRIALRSLLCFALGARAETNEIRAAQQYGLSYLALMLMEDGKLVEKHAKQAGLPELKVTWAKLGGPQAMNDALLSGSLDFGTGGVPSLITLWAKTRDQQLNVKGVGALNDMPNELIVSRPEVKSIRDLGVQDKIAVTSVKISTQALLLQMAAAKEWGDKEYEKLDPLTVSMSHPDSLTALLFGSGAISAHFASPPFSYQEMTKTTESIESLMQMMNDPKIVFTLEPHRMMTTADFMHRIGRIKVKPSSWKDLFFENVHSLKGS